MEGGDTQEPARTRAAARDTLAGMRQGAAFLVGTLAIAGCTTAGGGDGPSAISLGNASGSDTGGSAAADGASVSEGDATSTAGPTSSPATGGSDGAGSGSDGSAGADTTGGPPPMSCRDDPGACDAWVLPPGGAAWEAITIGGPAALAPAGDVLAAFDIEAPERAYVLSASDVSILDLATRSWTTKLSFDDTFPQVGTDALKAGYSVPPSMADSTHESVTLASADTAYIYTYDISAEAFAFEEATVFGAGWELPEAPMGADLRAMWVDLANADGWVDDQQATPCGAASPIGPNLPVLAGTRVHVLEAGTCFEFFAPVDYEDFAPFQLPGAPDPTLVGAAAFSTTQGLWLFRGA